jgi:hypothetical protein
LLIGASAANAQGARIAGVLEQPAKQQSEDLTVRPKVRLRRAVHVDGVVEVEVERAEVEPSPQSNTCWTLLDEGEFMRFVRGSTVEVSFCS